MQLEHVALWTPELHAEAEFCHGPNLSLTSCPREREA
jgi:hypothetical protein